MPCRLFFLYFYTHIIFIVTLAAVQCASALSSRDLALMAADEAHQATRIKTRNNTKRNLSTVFVRARSQLHLYNIEPLALLLRPRKLD